MVHAHGLIRYLRSSPTPCCATSTAQATWQALQVLRPPQVLLLAQLPVIMLPGADEGHLACRLDMH